MNETDASASGWLARSERRVLLLLLVLGAGAWLWVGPLTKMPLTPDEGQHLVGARYILLDSANLVRHQRYVGGEGDWPQLARTYWTYPPTIDALYAGFLALFGVGSVAHGLPLLLAGWLAAASLFQIGRRVVDRDTGLICATLLLWSRAALDQGTRLECEPFVAALGIAAVAAAVEGIHENRARFFALAGVLGGLAFLFKLWLAFPVALTLGALGLSVSGWSWRRRWTVTSLMGACFVAAGSSHLGFIAAVAPEDLPLWGAVYTNTFGRSAPPGVAQPWWFYAAVVYRDLCVFAPALLLAPVSLAKHPCAGRVSLLAILGSAATTLLLLSTSEVKESLYAYVLTPALLLFVALGLRQLATMGASVPAVWYRRARWAMVTGSCLLAALVLWAWESGSLPAALGGYFALGHAVVMVGGALSVLAFGPGARRPPRLALALCGLGAVWGGVAVAERLAEQTQAALPAVAAHFADLGSARPPGPGSAECAFASSYPVPLSYYTWQRGCSWVQLQESAGALEPARLTAGLRWFQLDAEYAPRLGAPANRELHDELLRYLAAHTTEVSATITPAVARHTRVFVRPPGDDESSR